MSGCTGMLATIRKGSVFTRTELFLFAGLGIIMLAEVRMPKELLYYELRFRRTHMTSEQGMRFLIAIESKNNTPEDGEIMSRADWKLIMEKISGDWGRLMIDDGVIWEVVQEGKMVSHRNLTEGERRMMETVIANKQKVVHGVWPHQTIYVAV